MRRLAWPALLVGLSACSLPDPGPDELAANRRKNIGRLRTYAERGRFPKNEDFPGEFVPYFVDRHGTPCAVAYLMLQDGWADAVREIASRDNHVRIGDVRGGPLLDWIRTSGLTQEECALIQPRYDRRAYTSDPVEQVNPELVRRRIPPWTIPGLYRNRPNLPEPLRIRSHLLDVLAALEFSAAVAVPRTTLGFPLAEIRPKEEPIRAYRWIAPPRIVVLEEAGPVDDFDDPEPVDPLEIFERRFEHGRVRWPARSDP